jgi:hypothetical protein
MHKSACPSSVLELATSRSLSFHPLKGQKTVYSRAL